MKKLELLYILRKIKRCKIMVRPDGFEPPTLCSEDRCSNPLSYGRSEFQNIIELQGILTDYLGLVSLDSFCGSMAR